MTNQFALPFLQLRGGSSKGIFFHDADLPEKGPLRDAALKWVMGAYGDPRQIDGLGGADPLSSKIAIVKKSERDGVDIDYQFIQAVVGEDRLDDTPNCGNILAAVGAFALETGLIMRHGDSCSVTVFMENSGKICHLDFPIKDGLPIYEGDAKIDGVKGGAAPVICRYEGLAGALCGALLPTGNACDLIDGVKVTCLDNGMPVIALRAEDFGLTGREAPDVLDHNEALKARLESIRLQAGPMMNLGDVTTKSVPKMCLISSASKGGAFSTRTFIPKQCHKAIGVLGAVTAATAACLADSAVADLADIPEGNVKQLSIEHPSGGFDVQLTFQAGEIVQSGLVRTARLLARGKAYIPYSVLEGSDSKGLC